MHHHFLAPCLALLIGLAGITIAMAQTRPSESPKVVTLQPVAPPVETPLPVYERDMMRLAEIIGSLAFLRRLCQAPDAAQWPSRMKELLEAEASSPLRKERLAGAYNRGFRGFSLTYRNCTPSATAAIRLYLTEGDTVSRAIALRFGG